MATFPAIAPAYGATKNSAPKVRKTQFGDGYEQRIKFGLNQNPKTWDLSWNNITEANADTIEAFLDARADDGDSFDWTPPGEPSSSKWVCETWQKTIPYTGRAVITATFRQVFEP
jgi:phage-related protein